MQQHKPNRNPPTVTMAFTHDAVVRLAIGTTCAFCGADLRAADVEVIAGLDIRLICPDCGHSNMSVEPRQ
jgi:hypothetical protein